MYSLIIPVFNRPDEMRELLASIAAQDFTGAFEVVIAEDGSDVRSDKVCRSFEDRLNIQYFYKLNSGPGDSRNQAMKRAKGQYFLIFDSDCILPPHYLSQVDMELRQNPCDCFGGPDRAQETFSDVQKAINFAMTSFVSTGGIRGGNENITRFQPRSFNMGLSKAAFEASNGFSRIHPGEDPDLVLRLWKMGFKTRLFPNAWVYHKRRIDWRKFYTQVHKFGKARPILDHWHPSSRKWAFYAPSLFIIGLMPSIFLSIAGSALPLLLYLVYFIIVLIMAIIQTSSIRAGLMSVAAVAIQFYGYGTGFLKAFYKVRLQRRSPESAFPELFFK